MVLTVIRRARSQYSRRSTAAVVAVRSSTLGQIHLPVGGSESRDGLVSSDIQPGSTQSTSVGFWPKMRGKGRWGGRIGRKGVGAEGSLERTHCPSGSHRHRTSWSGYRGRGKCWWGGRILSPTLDGLWEGVDSTMCSQECGGGTYR